MNEDLKRRRIELDKKIELNKKRKEYIEVCDKMLHPERRENPPAVTINVVTKVYR